MKTLLMTAALGTLALFTSGCLEQSNTLKIEEAISFATSADQPNGAVFLKIENGTPNAVEVTGASTDVSASVELHTMAMEGDVMQMRKVDNFKVEPGASLELKPGGDHIMLMGLKAPLAEGQNFALSLTTSGGPVNVDVTIKAAGEIAGDDHGH